MTTGNYIADIPNKDSDPRSPYFEDDDHIHFKTCDFCNQMINEYEINWEVKDGKNTGVVYCDDCKDSFKEWQEKHKFDDLINDPLKNFGTFIDGLF